MESVYGSVLSSFSDPAMKPDYSTVDVHWSGNSLEPHAASTWTSPNGDAWFALASLDGNIRVVFLPADSDGKGCFSVELWVNDLQDACSTKMHSYE